MQVRRHVVALLGTALLGGALVGGGAAGAATSWTTYHADNARSGVDPSEPGLNPLGAAWSSPLDNNHVFGQPVVAAGRVFVATEGDNVYALDAHDGHVLWHRNIGQPLTNVGINAGCGDIDPLGITSTPVVDLGRATVYVVGEVSNGGAPPVTHRLVGLNIFTGSVTRSVVADPVLPSGESAIHLQQRASLAVANGRVYVGYGGLAGDCGLYHGWLVGIDEAGTRPPVQFNVTPNSTGGAIWQAGGGPSIDGAGNVYVTTGNPNSGTAAQAPWSEAVVKLPASLGATPLAAFQDPAASGDLDLGTGDATLLPNGDLFAVGKTDIGYLLHQSNLHKSTNVTGTVCGSDPDGGGAYDAATNSMYVPCRNGGIQQVVLGALPHVGWHSSGANGAPILVAGNLWAVGYNGGVLRELNAISGAPIQTVPVGDTVPTFASPAAALGLLLVGTDHGIRAFDGPSGPPPPAPPPPRPTAGYWLAATDGGVFNFGLAGFHGSKGATHLNAPIVAIARTPSGRGYWLAAADGGVFTFGDARFFGSKGGAPLNQPIVGMTALPTGTGYWLVARDGGVFTFGAARFHGSKGGSHLNASIVTMSATPSGAGYWLAAADGGVFTFGDARFFGSKGGAPLNQPIVGMSAMRNGLGYWLVARDGGIFTFGRAGFHGSLGATVLNAPIVAMASTLSGSGYWLMASDGGFFTFGDAPFEGSLGAMHINAPIVGAAAEP